MIRPGCDLNAFAGEWPVFIILQMSKFLILLLLPALSFSQTIIHKGERTREPLSDYAGIWMDNNLSASDTAGGEKIIYYPNGTIRARGNRINGEWQEFFENGRLKIKQTFVNGKTTGETFCYAENGSILLPHFISQKAIKNDTSILNNSRLGLYRLFDSRDAKNDILYFGTSLSGPIQVCDNEGLSVIIGKIHFAFKTGGLMVHVKADTLCNEFEEVQRFSLPSLESKTKVFKAETGRIEVEQKKMLCENTGHNPVKIKGGEGDVYFKDAGNLIFFEYDIDKGGSKEFFMVNYYPCENHLEIYKIDN